MNFLVMSLVCLSTGCLGAYEVFIQTPEGEIESVNVSEEQPISGFIHSLRCSFGDEYECVVAMVRNGEDQFFYQKTAKFFRNYADGVSASQAKDIAYIVNTLGTASLVKIAKERSSLKRAGDRLESVHPFHFLGTIFSDDKMKASLQAIKNRGGWVWSGFFDGIQTSLSEEQKNQNLLPYVNDFAATIGLSPEEITPVVQNGNWKILVNTLIDKVPRSGNTKRYNM